MDKIAVFAFKKISLHQININEYYDVPAKSVFTTVPWMRYLLEDNPGAEPILLRITRCERFVGYFTGMLVNKLGIGIVGSPFRGWSTCFMGLDLASDADRVLILDELSRCIFSLYRCRYFQVIDRQLSINENSIPKAFVSSVDTLELGIDRSDEELFKVFKTDCRNYIRQFERKGASIEVAEPNAEFAAEFHQQLVDVFTKQGMAPTYSAQKVECLIRFLAEEDMVLCLRVRDPEGKSVATSIFPGYGEKCFYWGGASYRSTQFYRPNEYMIWSAIRYWRDRGAKTLDLMGVRDYKKKFGPDQVTYQQVEFAKPALIIGAKNMAEKAYFWNLHLKEKLGRMKNVP